MSQGSIAQIEDGTTKRSVHIPKIAEFLGVTPSWLEYGDGEKQSSGINLETDEKALISNFRRLNAEDKKAVSKIVKALSLDTYGSQKDA